MTAKLCNAGYLHHSSPELQDALAPSPSKAPTDDTSCAASAVTASEPADSLGSASLTAKPEDDSSIDDVLFPSAGTLEATPSGAAGGTPGPRRG